MLIEYFQNRCYNIFSFYNARDKLGMRRQQTEFEESEPFLNQFVSLKLEVQHLFLFICIVNWEFFGNFAIS